MYFISMNFLQMKRRDIKKKKIEKKNPRGFFIGRRRFYETGFGLVEVLMAIFIIFTTLVGIMTLLTRTILSSAVSSSKMVATNLAQEGIEVVRNIRDLETDSSNWDNWYESISGTTDYLVQYNDSDLRVYQDIPLNFESATGRYGYDFGTATAFAYKRKITLQKISDTEIKVTAQMDWTEHGQAQTLTVEDRLWNWR